LVLVSAGGLLAALGFRPYAPGGSAHGPSDKRGALAAAAATSSLVMVLIALTYAVAVVPRVNQARARGPREMAEAFRRAVPKGAVIWVAAPAYQPFWYYLEPDVRYVRSLGEVPAAGRFVLLPSSRNAGDLGRDPRGREALSLVTAVDGQRRSFSLFELSQSGNRAALFGP
jgi:hypothetical protein